MSLGRRPMRNRARVQKGHDRRARPRRPPRANLPPPDSPLPHPGSSLQAMPSAIRQRRWNACCRWNACQPTTTTKVAIRSQVATWSHCIAERRRRTTRAGGGGWSCGPGRVSSCRDASALGGGGSDSTAVIGELDVLAGSAMRAELEWPGGRVPARAPGWRRAARCRRSPRWLSSISSTRSAASKRGAGDR
jgi:hypothetical protein